MVPDELQAAIVLFCSLLDERQRRLYAGLEALKLGHGGDRRIADLLGLDPTTPPALRNIRNAGLAPTISVATQSTLDSRSRVEAMRTQVGDLRRLTALL